MPKITPHKPWYTITAINPPYCTPRVVKTSPAIANPGAVLVCPGDGKRW